MQFDLRKFIATGRQPYHAEFQCDLSAHDYAGARIPQPVTAVFEAVAHDMTREHAIQYVNELATFFNCGWEGMLRLK